VAYPIDALVFNTGRWVHLSREIILFTFGKTSVINPQRRILRSGDVTTIRRSVMLSAYGALKSLICLIWSNQC